ncbi:uncharacterized protein RMCB_6317 [Mycolicibacterium brisbanense]|uniref:Uncharacterized protein n=1 Tax=Mycolicibacterium brisbanense TaxID=146020 RepID=A0A100W5Z3_9MYCO|nr:uncharacterized protein RMCB_6317 [Mycolicibacterium brisbanense]
MEDPPYWRVTSVLGPTYPVPVVRPTLRGAKKSVERRLQPTDLPAPDGSMLSDLFTTVLPELL